MKNKLPREVAEEVARPIMAFLETAGIRYEICGSWRRGERVIGDLDILVDCSELPRVVEYLNRVFVDREFVREWVGGSKAAFTVDGFQVDLKNVGPDSWGIHAFGSTEVPVYGIFGPTDPKCRMLYSEPYWSPEYRRCGKQYCWYKPCEDKITKTKRFPCINSRTSLFYYNDIKRKLGRFL